MATNGDELKLEAQARKLVEKWNTERAALDNALKLMREHNGSEDGQRVSVDTIAILQGMSMRLAQCAHDLDGLIITF